MSPANVVFYHSTFAATLKIRSDITKVKHILDSKKIHYEDVDLSEQPHRRVDMLKYSDNNHTLPQLHVNNRFIGSADEIQELEDWGELEAILRGVSPGKLAAESAAAAQAEALAYSASLTAGAASLPPSPPTLAQPSFSPPSSPPQPEIIPDVDEAHDLPAVEQQEEQQEDQEDRTAEEICTPVQKLETREESPRAAETEELEQEGEEQEEEEEERKEEGLEPRALDVETEKEADLIIENEQEEGEEPQSLLDVSTEESCYFSPILLRSDSQQQEEYGEEGGGEGILIGCGIGDTTTQPELVRVQANLQALDLFPESSPPQQDSPSPSPPLSTISPSPPPSPSPFQLKEEESEPALELDVTLQVEQEHEQEYRLDQQYHHQEDQSPSGKTPLREHPLGDAVHAHAVPLDLEPAPSTTEDEEYIIIDNINNNYTIGDINSAEEEEY